MFAVVYFDTERVGIDVRSVAELPVEGPRDRRETRRRRRCIYHEAPWKPASTIPLLWLSRDSISGSHSFRVRGFLRPGPLAVDSEHRLVEHDAIPTRIACGLSVGLPNQSRTAFYRRVKSDRYKIYSVYKTGFYWWSRLSSFVRTLGVCSRSANPDSGRHRSR